MRPPWRFTPGLLTPEQCVKLIEVCEKTGFAQAGQFNGEFSARNAQVCYIRDAHLLKFLKQFMQSQAADFGIQADKLEYVSICKYEVGQGYGWHHDINWQAGQEGFNRKMSLTVDLNTGYEGGHLNFDEVANGSPRGIGGATIFPSYLRHEIATVTKGTRYSLVAWIEGEPWQ